MHALYYTKGKKRIKFFTNEMIKELLKNPKMLRENYQLIINNNIQNNYHNFNVK